MSKSPLVSPPCGAIPVPSRPTYLPPLGGAFFGFADEASSTLNFSFFRLGRFPWTCHLHDVGFSETSTSQRQQWGWFEFFFKYL